MTMLMNSCHVDMDTLCFLVLRSRDHLFCFECSTWASKNLGVPLNQGPKLLEMTAHLILDETNEPRGDSSKTFTLVLVTVWFVL